MRPLRKGHLISKGVKTHRLRNAVLEPLAWDLTTNKTEGLWWASPHGVPLRVWKSHLPSMARLRCHLFSTAFLDALFPQAMPEAVYPSLVLLGIVLGQEQSGVFLNSINCLYDSLVTLARLRATFSSSVKWNSKALM